MLRDVVALLREPVRVSEGRAFDDRVMSRVRRLPRHRRRGAWSRLGAPRTVTIRPLRWLVLAACLIAAVAVDVAARKRSLAGNGGAAPALATRPAPPVKRPVQFVLVAPAAKKVAVVGDFNGWDVSHLAYRAQHQGGGVWSVTAPVPLGHHRYSFVVDDSVWVADPAAPRVLDDNYGVPSSAIVVTEPEP